MTASPLDGVAGLLMILGATFYNGHAGLAPAQEDR